MRSISHLEQMNEIAGYLHDAGKLSAASDLNEILVSTKNTKLKSLRQLIPELAKIAKINTGEPNLEDLVTELKSLERLVLSLSSKQFGAFYLLFHKELEQHSGMNVEMLARVLRLNLGGKDENASFPEMESAGDYVKQLGASLHNEQKFPLIFEKLKNDKSMKREQIVQIASEIAFPMSKSTSKKVALEKIWNQFDASRTMGAKIRAQEGKSAA